MAWDWGCLDDADVGLQTRQTLRKAVSQYEKGLCFSDDDLHAIHDLSANRSLEASKIAVHLTNRLDAVSQQDFLTLCCVMDQDAIATEEARIAQTEIPNAQQSARLGVIGMANLANDEKNVDHRNARPHMRPTYSQKTHPRQMITIDLWRKGVDNRQRLSRSNRCAGNLNLPTLHRNFFHRRLRSHRQ